VATYVAKRRFISSQERAKQNKFNRSTLMRKPCKQTTQNPSPANISPSRVFTTDLPRLHLPHRDPSISPQLLDIELIPPQRLIDQEPVRIE
jgi:hypothetical protein